MSQTEHFDVVVIGSGPAGHEAALQARRANATVAIVEKNTQIGGACLHHGTIPSKTLRETARMLRMVRRRPDIVDADIKRKVKLAAILDRLDIVINSHTHALRSQLDQHGVQVVHGRAEFIDAHTVSVLNPDHSRRRLRANYFVVATGSRPRPHETIEIDHEHILDSDSLLSLIYLPETLTIIGSGVIACEYASILAALGTVVTMVSTRRLPLSFVDPDLSTAFVEKFPGRYIHAEGIESVRWNGADAVITVLSDGTEIKSDKAFVAAGRLPNIEHLKTLAAGVAPSAPLRVDEHYRTNAPHIYAVGDVIGPPGLATTAMEQGRRAMAHAYANAPGFAYDCVPVGIYTIPDIASVGLTEPEARRKHGRIRVGKAKFDEVARGQISGETMGLLKLVTDATGEQLLGAHIFGEGATELIHIAQMIMTGDLHPDVLIEGVFNFPTLAEAYRVAAQDLTLAPKLSSSAVEAFDE